MSDSRAIGVIDSGLGGLTVVRELHRLMPKERIYYFGDTASGLYGNRSDEWIHEATQRNASFLVDKDIKLLVVACSTMSSVAGTDRLVAADLDVPVIGSVQPGAKAAILRTAERKIGVIGTRATIRSQAFTRAVREIDGHMKVYGQACPLLVPLVDEGLVDNDIARLTAQYYLYRQVNIGIDCLVLACTHYPLLMEVIQETVGTRIQLIDSSLWLAKEAQDILIALNGLSGDPDGFGGSAYYFTDTNNLDDQPILSLLGTEMGIVEKVAAGE